MEGGHGGRRALSDQIRTRDSSNNLRNLIKVREEDGNAPVAPNRTLLDIIREEEPGHRLAAGGHKIKWKSFKDRIRLRRSGTAWSSSSGHGHGHGHSVSPPIYHPPPPDVAEEPSGDEPPTPESPGPARVSLMTLLETDRYSAPLGGSSDGEIEYEEESGEEEEEKEEEGVEFVCCVCMVRHKGAAFIPCGHTFCRLCSRELWVDRGNCPLCNGYILEILDIF